MNEVPLHVRTNMWMQHDGAAPHYALCSRQVMNEIFDEKWIFDGPQIRQLLKVEFFVNKMSSTEKRAWLNLKNTLVNKSDLCAHGMRYVIFILVFLEGYESGLHFFPEHQVFEIFLINAF